MGRRKKQTPLERAIAIMGTQRALASALGVTNQAVQKWRRQVPASRVLAIEAATGGSVSRHELRPDIYPNDKKGGGAAR